jgi:putative PEP-CTERM system TPR-repeat lipoprotein
VAKLSNLRCAFSAALVVTLAGCAPRGEELYARAETAIEKGDVRAAVIDLKTLLQSEPQNAQARAMLSLALLQSGDTSGGEIELRKARDLGAPSESILVPSCRLLLAKGETEKLLETCKPQSGPASAKADLEILYGNGLLIASRASDAKPFFESALGAEPDNVEALLGLASAMHTLEGPTAARAILAKASPAIKKNARYWLIVAGTDMGDKDFAAAAKSFQLALDKSTKDSTERLMAMGGLAEAQMRQGDVKAADTTTAELIEAAPENMLVKQLRGQVAAAGGKYDEARSLLEEVVSAQPENYEARTLLGIVNVQQGNLDQAEMHFAAVVANQPDNARAQRLLAEVRAQQDSPESSLAGVRMALEQTANDPTMLAMASRLSLASGDRAQALSYLAQAAEQTTENSGPQTQLEIANGYLAAGEIDRAIEILEAIPAGGITDFQREYLLMLSLLRKGETEAAVSRARALVARSDDKPEVRILAANVYGAAGKPELAREQLVAAQKLTPDNLQVLTNLARLDLSQGNPTAAEPSFKRILDQEPDNLVATLGMAATAGARKDSAATLKWLTKASADHPASAEAHLALAQFHLAANDVPKAKAVMEAATKANPKSGALANARGLVLLGARDLPMATASFAEAVRLEPNADGYHLNLARAQMLSRDPKGALSTINALLQAKPKMLAALAVGASASLQSGDLEKATGYIERMRQVAPDSPLRNQLEGDLAMSQKRYKEALSFYEKADPAGRQRSIVIARYVAGQRSGAPEPQRPVAEWVAKNPADVDAVAILADWKSKQGDKSGAVRTYEAALKTSPGNGILLNNLAMLYLESGDGRAVATAEKAYKALPEVPATMDTYGWALLGAGKTDQAVELLREASKGLPDNAEVQYHLAAALAKAGNKPEAVVLVKQSLGGQLAPAIRTDAQKLLAELSR